MGCARRKSLIFKKSRLVVLDEIFAVGGYWNISEDLLVFAIGAARLITTEDEP